MRLLLSALAAVAVTTVVGAQSNSRPKPVDRTTPIQEQMSPAQRANGREHAKTKLSGWIRLLDEAVWLDSYLDGTGDFPRDSASTLLSKAACAGSAAVRGVVKAAKSFPMEDGT